MFKKKKCSIGLRILSLYCGNTLKKAFSRVLWIIKGCVFLTLKGVLLRTLSIRKAFCYNILPRTFKSYANWRPWRLLDLANLYEDMHDFFQQYCFVYVNCITHGLSFIWVLLKSNVSMQARVMCLKKRLHSLETAFIKKSYAGKQAKPALSSH